MIDQTRMKPSLSVFLMAIVMVTVAIWMSTPGPDGLLLASGMLGFGGMVIVLLYGLPAWYVWYRGRLLDLETRRRQVEAICPRSEIMRMAGQLTPDQAALVPKASTETEIGIVPGDDEPRYFLISETGNIPLEFIEDFLSNSGVVSCCPVRRYPDKSENRSYAVSYTDYLVRKGYASPANSNRSAQWIGGGRRRAAELLGLEIEEAGNGNGSSN